MWTSDCSRCLSNRNSKENVDLYISIPRSLWFTYDLCITKNNTVFNRIHSQKHRNRPSSKLLKIEQGSMWQDFKRHIPFIKETDIRRWYTYLIDSTHDPFAEDMLYHVGQMIGHEYVLRNLNNQLEDSHLQNINLTMQGNCSFATLMNWSSEIEKLDNLIVCLAIKNLLLVIMD